MRLLLEFKIESITDASAQDATNKGIKAVLSFTKKSEKKGLETIEVISVKSLVDVDKKTMLNKLVLAEVEQTIISNKFGPASVYYKIINLKLAQ